MQNALESLSKAELIALISQKDALIQQKEASIQEKETLIARLQRMLFGQKRERFTESPIQLPLDFGEHLSEQDIQQLAELITKKHRIIKKLKRKKPICCGLDAVHFQSTWLLKRSLLSRQKTRPAWY